MAWTNTNNLCSGRIACFFFVLFCTCTESFISRTWKIKKQICPFGLTKEDSGTDMRFITGRQMEVWRDKGGTEERRIHIFNKHVSRGTKCQRELLQTTARISAKAQAHLVETVTSDYIKHCFFFSCHCGYVATSSFLRCSKYTIIQSLPTNVNVECENI